MTAQEKTTYIGSHGYERVYLAGRHYDVHRLLAEQLIPNPENKPCVNHKDGDKLNNSLENLEWVTFGDNVRHAFRTGLMNTKRGPRSIDWKAVRAVNAGEIMEFRAIVHAAGKTGISRTSIINCLKGRSATAGGYRWEYV